MNWILETIAKYTGLTERDDLLGVYDYMADNVRAFGSLSPADWRREAKAALATWQYAQTPEGKAYLAALEAQYASC
jgi:hypothetical protein